MINDEPYSVATKALVAVAVRALRETGRKLEKVRGGRIWTIEENGSRKRLAIRRTRDRYIAFNPQPNRRWKTLDDVDIVIVAAVDHVDSPTAVFVYRFNADEVRRRFNESYDATIAKGNKVSFNAGWWISLDKTRKNLAGEGIAATQEPFCRIPIEELPPDHPPKPLDPPDDPADQQDTVDQIIDEARRCLAACLGVDANRIKVGFRVEDR